MPRFLGVDYGRRRVGLALSDPLGCIAAPLRVIDRREEDPLEAICREAEFRRVEVIVVGLPINMDGSDGPAAREARKFAVELRRRGKWAVEMCDERMSSSTAERSLIEGGARRDKRKKVIDKIAAQVILQHYLDTFAGGANDDIPAENN